MAKIADDQVGNTPGTGAPGQVRDEPGFVHCDSWHGQAQQGKRRALDVKRERVQRSADANGVIGSEGFVGAQGQMDSGAQPVLKDGEGFTKTGVRMHCLDLYLH